MITEPVGGVLRQVWDFKGGRFYGPIKIGAGYRDAINHASADGMMKTGAFDEIVSELGTRKKPNGLPDKAWAEQIKNEAMQKLTARAGELLANTNTAEAKLAILKILMTPFPGSPDVRTWYMEIAEDGEVEQVINFSKGLSPDKTETAPLTNTAGKTTARKKAVR